MKYISLFSGIGGFEIAIHDKFFDAECLFYSEIDKHAIKVYSEHFPSHFNMGNIIDAYDYDLEAAGFGPDLLVGGSPCQDLSIAKKDRQGLKGEKSKLFFEYCRVLEVTLPKFFILENVASMSEENKNLMIDYLTESSGFQKIYCTMIDSGLVSAQKRKRLYFTNFPVSQPEDRKLYLENILAWSKSGRLGADGKRYTEERITEGKANTLTTGKGCGSGLSRNYIPVNSEFKYIDSARFLNNKRMIGQLKGVKDKANCMGATMYKGSQSNTATNIFDGKGYRMITPLEAERLQTFPDDWTKNISTMQRYKTLGNAVTVEVIAHILDCLPKI